MAAMTMRDRVRKWLGVDQLATKEDVGNLGVNLLASASGDQKALMEHLIVLRDTLPRIEQMMVERHIGRPIPSLPLYDWEQVQVQELAEMLANPPKDEN